MVEKQELEALKPDDESPPLPSFVEVLCKSSGKLRRFAPGTDAAFALNLINKKLLLLHHHVPNNNNNNNNNNNSNTTPLLASHIEAVKLGHDSEEEEPISFGPTAALLNYGSPWILQTVVAQSHTTGPATENVQNPKTQSSAAKGSKGYRSAKKTSQPLGLLYIGKILLALLMIFAIGTIFTLALENLPTLLLYINTNM